MNLVEQRKEDAKKLFNLILNSLSAEHGIEAVRRTLVKWENIGVRKGRVWGRKQK